jgi:hypothetical protein
MKEQLKKPTTWLAIGLLIVLLKVFYEAKQWRKNTQKVSEENSKLKGELTKMGEDILRKSDLEATEKAVNRFSDTVKQNKAIERLINDDEIQAILQKRASEEEA